MVVQATFLPDIVNSLDGLGGYGGYLSITRSKGGKESSSCLP